MAFVKIYKNNAYFKRFQTQFRRRREGKTDYYARKRLTMQDKNKFNTMKYRFVPRFTNKKVTCQIIYATLNGDKVLCQASSEELKKYGVKTGLANYSAAYATGLLCARRILAKVGLDSKYQGQAKADGEYYQVGEQEVEGKRPFKAVLDLGLVATTTGNKVFSALKGACDGGLDIPHNTKRFPGNKKAGDDVTYDAKVHRERIFGAHVDKYMAELKKESKEDFTKQFSDWEKNLTEAKVKSVQELYTKVHAEIRKNPVHTKKAAAKNPKRDHKKYRSVRQNAVQRKERVQKKFQIAAAKKTAKQ